MNPDDSRFKITEPRSSLLKKRKCDATEIVRKRRRACPEASTSSADNNGHFWQHNPDEDGADQRTPREQSPESSVNDGQDDLRDSVGSGSSPELIENGGHGHTSDSEDDSPLNLGQNFDKSDALNCISSIMIYNNTSDSFMKDIYAMMQLGRKFPHINLKMLREARGTFEDYGSRTYSFCTNCASLLNSSGYCRRMNCRSRNIKQTNITGIKKIITFDVIQQLKEMFEANGFDENILKMRSKSKSELCGSVSSLPKYIETVKVHESENPDVITLFFSCNTDGFVKSGNGRVSYWPVYIACHDIKREHGPYSEYRPENLLLAAIMQAGGPISSSDFDSLFERLRLQMDTEFEAKINGIVLTFRMRLFRSVIDMDCSRKIHNVPNWHKYGSCDRCTVHGTRVKKGRGWMISWFPKRPAKCYCDTLHPKDYKPSILPNPWENGFDSLHLIEEGTSKDLMRQIFSNGRDLNIKIDIGKRQTWKESLRKCKQPKGHSSRLLMEVSEFSSKTGAELQKMYNVAIPTVIVCSGKPNLPAYAAYLHFLFTRSTINTHINERDCEIMKRLQPLLSKLFGRKFSNLYTLKFHTFVDHLIPNLAKDGSPILASAAPFERGNQVLGRHVGPFNTNALKTMSTRFLSLQRTTRTTKMAVNKHDSPIGYPSTMRATLPIESVKRRILDSEPLSSVERTIIDSVCRTEYVLSLQTVIRDKSYETKKRSDGKAVQASTVYFFDKGRVQFGSIDRIVKCSGNEYFLLNLYKTVDPFGFLMSWAAKHFAPKSTATLTKKINQFYKEIVANEKVMIFASAVEGYAMTLEFDGRMFISRL